MEDVKILLYSIRRSFWQFKMAAKVKLLLGGC